MAAIAAFLILPAAYIPGIFWAWALPCSTVRPASRLPFLVVRAATVMICGLIVTLLSGLVLAELGRLRPVPLFAALLAASIVGGRLGRAAAWREVRTALPGLVAVSALSGAIMLAPDRGEWIVGGWDPGVYVNQGVLISRTGTTRPPPSPMMAELAASSLEAVTRRVGPLHELFPGFPVDPETGAFQLYFFRLTPVAIALLHLAGDLPAAVRVNDFMAAIAALSFIGMLLGAGVRLGTAICAGVALVAQPIFLYHAHTPTTEMLQLGIVCALFGLASAKRGGAAASLASAILLFLAVVNRISFVLFGALFALVIAVLDLDDEDRRAVHIRHGLALLGLACGLIFDLAVTRVATARLGHILPTIFRATALLVVAAIAIDAVAARPAWRQRLRRWSSAPALYTIVAGVAIVALALLRTRLPGEFATNASAIASYIGWPIMAVVAVGALRLLWRVRSDQVPRSVIAYAAYAALVTLVLLRHKHVADLYPWATKRFLAYTVPAAALLAGYALSWPLECRRRRWRLARATPCLLALCLGLTGPGIHAARSGTEYNGLSDRLDCLAAEFNEGDIVIADHFRWGTPLACIYGIQVLNGERFWKDARGDELKAVFENLQTMTQDSGQILFLTSTDHGVELYPWRPDGLDWSLKTGAVVYREVIHSPRNRGFKTRDRGKRFKLFTSYESGKGPRRECLE